MIETRKTAAKHAVLSGGSLYLFFKRTKHRAHTCYLFGDLVDDGGFERVEEGVGAGVASDRGAAVADGG